MKQEATKKNKKLIWLIAGLAALLVVVGVVLAIFLMPGQQKGPAGPVGGRADLYWNVDRLSYQGNEETGGLSTREPAEDGLYHIRFAYNGELVEYTIADKRLVNVIDFLDVVGLVKDADGNVIDAVDPTTLATEVAKSFFVMTNKNGKLTMNSSLAMNGMELPAELGDLTQIYDVTPTAEVPGQFGEVETMDKVLVYANDLGETTHVFITERQPEAEVYWRVGRYYNSTTKQTTRVPDENGIYTITFAKDGQQVDLKCKDKALVDLIEQKGVEYNSPHGLVLDEEGYIIERVEPVVALRGKVACSEYHVTAIDGNQITATRLLSGSENGKTVTVTLPEGCPVYNVCPGGSADYIGEPTELQMYDRIICYTDMEGTPVLVYAMYRIANVPMYWNITRFYNDGSKTWGREPNSSGYYVFQMAVEGRQVTLRTKDKKIAEAIDALGSQLMGLELDGDIIKRVYKPINVSGGDVQTAYPQRYITEQIGTIMSLNTRGTNTTVNLVMSPDVEIYDVTGYVGTKIGQKATCQVGDLVRIATDYNNTITHIYILERYSGMPVYYNFNRYYSAARATTLRVPDEEGYYIFDMASRGKTVQVKTKDKKIADFIDSVSTFTVALDVNSEGIIRGAYHATTTVKFGYKASDWHAFQKFNGDGTYTTKVISTGELCTFKVADDVVIYNCSLVYNNNRGEISKLLPGDQIQGIATDNDDTVREIYIMTRKADSKFYYNPNRQYNTVTKETTRVPNEEGYYVFQLIVDGETKEFKTKSKALASSVDKYPYTPFGMLTSGNIITSVFGPTSINGVKAQAVSNYDVMSISGNKLTMTCQLPTEANVGKTVELKLASNYKAWDVSSYAKNRGERCKLTPGDRMICYTNEKDEVEWCLIWQKNTRKAGHISHCEHCDKDVYWMPYVGTTYFAKGDYHLYLPADRKSVQAVHGVKDMPADKQAEVVLDLNGFTMRAAETRCFLVYGTLNIVDSAGGGKIEGSTDTGVASGGAIMVGAGGTLNLYSGTLTENPNNVTNLNGGVVFVSANSTFNMYGGTIEGGTATNAGGNVYLAPGKANFNMTGGTIKGDVAVSSAEATVNIGGTAKITNGAKYGLMLPSGMVLPLKNVTADTNVVISTSGIFTEKADNIESYKANFTTPDPDFPITVKDGALAAGRLSYCEHCKEDVFWAKYTGATTSGHYVVTEDVTMSNQLAIGSAGQTSADIVIDLNGKTITIDGCNDKDHSTGRFTLLYGTLSIQDSSEAGTGKIISNHTSDRNGGVIMVGTGSTLNLYSGELTVADGVTAFEKGGVVSVGQGIFNMYGGKITNGALNDKAVIGGNIYVMNGEFNMYGGEVTGGSVGENAVGGNIGCDGTGKINIYGGVVTGGVAKAGGDIIHSGKGELTISGEATVGAVRIAATEVKATLEGTPKIAEMDIITGAKLTLGELADGTDVVVKAIGVFTEENEKAAEYAEKEYIKAAEGTLVAENDTLAVKVSAAAVKYCAHCDKEVEWIPFTPENAAGTGHWIVEENVSMSDQLKIGSAEDHSADVVIDLNGNTITVENCSGTGDSIGRFALLYGTLSIQDSSEEETGKITTKVGGKRSGGLLTVSTGGTLNLYSGELTVEEGVTVMRGGVLVQFTGTFNMYGGKVTNGTATFNAGDTATSPTGAGGCIYADAESVTNIYGGIISGGTADRAGVTYRGFGGNIYSRGVLTISQDSEVPTVITGGTAYKGGNVVLDTMNQDTANGRFTMSGGVIENGEAEEYGGSVWVRYKKSTFTMTGGVIKNGNSTKYHQDNVRLEENSMMIMTGGTIYSADGAADNQGSAITVNPGVLRLGGTATITRDPEGAEADVKYGNLRLFGGTCKLEILNDFTGTVSFVFTNKTTGYQGYSFAETEVVCGTMEGDTFVKGGSFSGTLTYAVGTDALAVTGADGVVSIANS